MQPPLRRIIWQLPSLKPLQCRRALRQANHCTGALLVTQDLDSRPTRRTEALRRLPKHERLHEHILLIHQRLQCVHDTCRAVVGQRQGNISVLRCCGLPRGFAYAHPVAIFHELDRDEVELARYRLAFAVALRIALRVATLEIAWVAGQIHE